MNASGGSVLGPSRTIVMRGRASETTGTRLTFLLGGKNDHASAFPEHGDSDDEFRLALERECIGRFRFSSDVDELAVDPKEAKLPRTWVR